MKKIKYSQYQKPRMGGGVFFGLIIVVLAGCHPHSQKNLPGPVVQPDQSWRSSKFARDNYAKYYKKNNDAPYGWIPPRDIDSRTRWEGIVIHHTVTEYGSASFIDRLHRDRGFDELGYHFVITNGEGGRNGKIEVGSRWRKQKHGAHCRVNPHDDNYWNEHTIGIGLIGNFEKKRPTNAQYDALARLVKFLQNRYNIPTSKVIGHGNVPGAKTLCPGKQFSFWELRRRLQNQRN